MADSCDVAVASFTAFLKPATRSIELMDSA